MFKYSTTTIINSDVDLKSGKALYSATEASSDGTVGAILRIKNDYTFEMPGITKVYKKVAAEPVMAQLTINCSELISALPTDTVYPVSGRIAVYVALEGSEESVFANDFYQKGMPLSVGYIIKDADVTGAELALQLQATINKFNLAMVGRKLYEATVSDDSVTLTSTNEYMRFKAAVALVDLGVKESELAHLFDGEDTTVNTQSVFTVDERGAQGFGTFSHLVKDLRLPTAQNTRWLAINSLDRPVPGTLYNQYIIYYEAPSGTNPSLAAVGHETVSKTTHIFWVKQDIADSFETVIAEVVGSSAVSGDVTAIFEEV